ncbi:TraX family protein [Anaerotignum sp.]|uniref:TraX family protein n=1 Tax=Anaerotignum sp. TaxID=2039241 RepID=UPI00271477A7|nr:TraX family protein [Anaerotignum sp.]
MGERNHLTAALAAILMVVDHIGAIFFPGEIGLRLIGRLSFPLFAYGIAQGVTYTSNFYKYIFRILLAAVISQPIYQRAFYSTNLNPLFTLALGAVVLRLWRKGEKERFLAGILLILSYWFKSSYSWYGVATIFLYGFYYCAKEISFYGQVLLQILYGFFTGTWLQSASLCAFPLAGKKWKQTVHLPKYFFYVFYPMHLLILIGVRGILY